MQNVEIKNLVGKGMIICGNEPHLFIDIFNKEISRTFHTNYFDAKISVKSDLNLEEKEFQVTLKAKLL